jgi:hypothetical protein
MSGLIGADNQFGKDFHNPDSNLQGIITSIYDVRTGHYPSKLSDCLRDFRSVARRVHWRLCLWEIGQAGSS